VTADRRRWPERADRFGRRAETVLLTVLLGAMVLLASGQIVLRNIWGTGLSWADEALRILVLWVTMLGAVAASREGKHVSIDAVSRYLPKRLATGSGRLIDAFVAVVCAVLAWESYLFVVDSFDAADTVLGGRLPAWSVQLVLPVGFALICYRFVVAAFRNRAAPAGRGPVH
jgi:TRAP-type C4-dicarboxylate transport system permease small subunit